LTCIYSRNLKTVFVDIETIYHYFSYGIHDPDAIRTFIQYCFENNQSHPPQYVLLAGDTSHDLDKNNRVLNIVPTHLSRMSGWGPGADDGYYATVNERPVPELCLGVFLTNAKISVPSLKRPQVTSPFPNAATGKTTFCFLAAGNRCFHNLTI
jgi:hypothetical protein